MIEGGRKDAMARTLMIGMLVLGATLGLGMGNARADDDEWDVADYDERFEERVLHSSDLARLDGYGEWVWVHDRGRVWRPAVDPDWRPYWRGHWTWRGQWVWVSADPWGGVPFHYGEWVWSRRHGWVWVPGTEWVPARVVWVISGPIVAWAPPSIHVSFGSDPRFWSYAEANTFRARTVRPYRVPPPRGYLNRRVVTSNIDRVFVPEPRKLRREFRQFPPPREPNRGFRGEAQAVTPRSRSGAMVGTASPPQSRHQGHGMGRGFERREFR
jgi:hypothetical protein